EQEKSYNNDLRAKELEARRLNIGEDSSHGKLIAKQRAEETEQKEQAIQKVLEDRHKRDEKFSELHDKAISNFQHNYRKLRLDQAEEVEKVKREATEANQLDRIENRLDKEHLSRTMNSQL